MKEKKIRSYSESFCVGKGTAGIILINIIVFIALRMLPGLDTNLFLNHEISIIQEKPWTLLTVFFSHDMILHVLLNMWVLFYFGSKLEMITNTKTVIKVYLMAGLLGAGVFPFIRLLIEGTGPGVGASAAVLGVVSAFAVMRPNTIILKSKAKWWVLALLIFSVLSAILHPKSLDSDVVHLTGIFVGLIYGYYHKNKEKKSK